MLPSLEGGYRPASLLAFCASLFLVAEALTDSGSALLNAYQIHLLDAIAFKGPILSALAEAQDARQRVLAALGLGIGLVAIIFQLIWVYRASRNARSLGAEGMQYSPGWSVGWFFVPVAGFFMPYFVFKELWKASSPSLAGKWRHTAVSPVLGVWWAVCVIDGLNQYSRWPVLLGHKTLADTMYFDARLVHGVALAFREFFWGRLIGDVVEIAVCVLTVVVVLSITNLQEQRAAVIASEGVSDSGSYAAIGCREGRL